MSERRLAPTMMGGVFVALCAFGVWECLDATIRVLNGSYGADNAVLRYPRWSVVHFIGAAIFATLLPFQLWESFRRKYGAVHRASGRVVFGLGTFATVSALALPFVMPARPLGERTFMTTFAIVFLLVLTRTVLAARRRAFAEHRRWAIWMVAMAMVPMTQRLLVRAVAMVPAIAAGSSFWEIFVTAAWFAWVVNLTAAEWWLSYSRHGSVVRSPTPTSMATATQG